MTLTLTAGIVAMLARGDPLTVPFMKRLERYKMRKVGGAQRSRSKYAPATEDRKHAPKPPRRFV
jgi:hypothetical protein